jgi:hypothetical protein
MIETCWSVLMCDIWINVLLQTSALVGPLYIVNWNARWNSEIEMHGETVKLKCTVKQWNWNARWNSEIEMHGETVKLKCALKQWNWNARWNSEIEMRGETVNLLQGSPQSTLSYQLRTLCCCWFWVLSTMIEGSAVVTWEQQNCFIILVSRWLWFNPLVDRGVYMCITVIIIIIIVVIFTIIIHCKSVVTRWQQSLHQYRQNS